MTTMADHYDMTRLHRLGRRRRAARAEHEAARQKIAADLPAARETCTWRQLSVASGYTENQLQNMWPADDRDQPQPHRRKPYDIDRMAELGHRRQAADNELATVRDEIAAELPAARAAQRTWREIAEATEYNMGQLQAMMLPEDERQRRLEQRRQRRRKNPQDGADR